VRYDGVCRAVADGFDGSRPEAEEARAAYREVLDREIEGRHEGFKKRFDGK